MRVLDLLPFSCRICLFIVALGAILANASIGFPLARASSEKQGPLPLLLTMESRQDMYHGSQDIMIKADLWALQPVTLCINPEHPEANFSVDVYRAGYGKVKSPQVVQLNHTDLNKVQHIQLQPGQAYHTLFNLKKLVPMPPMLWKTGEYRVQSKFFLCGETEKAEKGIPSKGPLHILILAD